MNLQDHVIRDLLHRALVEIKVSHGFRGRSAFRTWRGSRRSDIHLTNCCMNHRLVRAIRDHTATKA